ncbi:hypothetical protein ANN_18040 [Periplaneta americana]|uniref:Uncharacterized protein n=1 Tax=Periplaneta americana TaxID=6978 RepID=A0ABQ8SNW5_PERAM|nr:hypothetical protein ANN_18040 [Periplaneta americana]
MQQMAPRIALRIVITLADTVKTLRPSFPFNQVYNYERYIYLLGGPGWRVGIVLAFYAQGCGFDLGQKGQRYTNYATEADPRRRCDDNFLMDLREVGYDGRDWTNLAQDKDQWQGLCEDGNEPPGSLETICCVFSLQL